jgi:hypothetical protein
MTHIGRSFRFQSLWSKIHNPEYIEQLSERRRKELEFCKEVLSEEELKSSSSIAVAYYKARQKLAEEVLYEINPELAERLLEGEKIPIFNRDKLLSMFRRR